jgi:hypothetical protein
MTLEHIGNNFAGAFLGELVGYVSEFMTDRIRVHRGELGGSETGPGSGQMETLLDLTLDSLAQIIFLTLGISLVQRSVPAVTKNLDCMVFFIVGIGTQTTLPIILKKLTRAVVTKPDTVIVPNQNDNIN